MKELFKKSVLQAFRLVVVMSSFEIWIGSKWSFEPRNCSQNSSNVEHVQCRACQISSTCMLFSQSGSLDWGVTSESENCQPEDH